METQTHVKIGTDDLVPTPDQVEEAVATFTDLMRETVLLERAVVTHDIAAVKVMIFGDGHLKPRTMSLAQLQAFQAVVQQMLSEMTVLDGATREALVVQVAEVPLDVEHGDAAITAIDTIWGTALGIISAAVSKFVSGDVTALRDINEANAAHDFVERYKKRVDSEIAKPPAIIPLPIEKLMATSVEEFTVLAHKMNGIAGQLGIKQAVLDAEQGEVTVVLRTRTPPSAGDQPSTP